MSLMSWHSHSARAVEGHTGSTAVNIEEADRMQALNRDGKEWGVGPVSEADQTAKRGVGSELVDKSEQLVAVYTRESASVERLRAALSRIKCEGIRKGLETRLSGNAMYIAVAWPKGGGEPRFRTAASLEELLSEGLTGLGTEHGITKSLCQVLSVRVEVVTAVARRWEELRGLSVAAEIAKVTLPS